MCGEGRTAETGQPCSPSPRGRARYSPSVWGGMDPTRMGSNRGPSNPLTRRLRTSLAAEVSRSILRAAEGDIETLEIEKIVTEGEDVPTQAERSAIEHVQSTLKQLKAAIESGDGSEVSHASCGHRGTDRFAQERSAYV